MNILKVYDTMQQARYEAEQMYNECSIHEVDVKYITPYEIKINGDTYMFVSRQAELYGYRFDKIINCTTLGMPDRIRMCEL